MYMYVLGLHYAQFSSACPYAEKFYFPIFNNQYIKLFNVYTEKYTE